MSVEDLNRPVHAATEEQQPVTVEQTQETQEVQESSSETPVTFKEAGSARFDRARDGLKNMGTKMGSLFKSWGERTGRIGGKAKEYGMNGVHMAFAAPELVQAGAEKVDDTINAGKEAVVRGYDATKEWGAQKGEQAAEIGRSTAAAGERLAEAVSLRTNEAIDATGYAIERGYGNIRQFGENTVEAGKTKLFETKNRFSETYRSIIDRRIEGKLEAARARSEQASEEVKRLEAVQHIITMKKNLANDFGGLRAAA
jgi:hypothetical protein